MRDRLIELISQVQYMGGLECQLADHLLAEGVIVPHSSPERKPREFWKGAKMENLNAENLKNEIQSLIKALKDCGGWVKRGNGEGWFNHDILVDALALINSQEQRIKELAEEKNKVFEKGAENLTRLEEAYLKLEAENLKLTEENERWRAIPEELKKRYRLPESNEAYVITPFHLHEFIDQIAKELESGDG